MNDKTKARLDELFAMGLMFNGEAYVGNKDHNKDFYFPMIDIQFDSDEEWEKRIKEAKAELERRQK